MATDWTSPKTSDTHTNELAATRGRDESNARMDYTGDTNIPDGTIRWNKANNRFEIWSAASSTWSVLSSKYLINVDQVDGYDAGNASGNVPVSNGNVNSNLNADKLDGQHGTYFQARANHTGTQAPSTISPQGAGSGLNADLLDGLHSSAFLGVSAKAVDSDKLDGLDSSNFNRVIDLTGQVQKTSHRKSVIALCNLDNTNINRNSWSTGRISFHYSNGWIADLSVLYTASKKYDTTSMNWAAFISNASDVGPGIQPCTFTYNGVKYGGIHFYYHAAPHDLIVWEGNQTVEGSFEPFGLDYYDTLNNIALNTEVNDSLVIDGADIVKSTRAEFNNNLLWHAGNDGAGSGLDADLLDGKHLSEIGGGMKYQIFTSSGTFTVPSGVTNVKVTLIGGGGGGGGSDNVNYGGGGGGGGVYYRQSVNVTPGSNISVTIGSGGSGGGNNQNGSSGGTSSFGSYLSSTGGAGGKCNNGSAGAAGSPSTSYFTQAGGTSWSTMGHGGAGGSTVLGIGGKGTAGNAQTGVGFGAGGAGARYGSYGGNGSPGVCIIEWEE